MAINVKVDKRGKGGGGLLFTIAILLMVAGFAMEASGYDIALGALLFTIGFWLFFIPLIIIGVIFAIVIAVAAIAK